MGKHIGTAGWTYKATHRALGFAIALANSFSTSPEYFLAYPSEPITLSRDPYVWFFQPHP